MKKNLFTGLLVLLLAAAFFMGYQALAESEETAETGVLPGKAALELHLQDLQKNPININGPHDQEIYVLNFWATWCPPCREEMPELDAFARENKDKVKFYAVNIQESASDVNAFIQEQHYTLPILLDADGENAQAYHIKGIPTTIIIDRNGIIQYRKTGAVTKTELDDALTKIAEAH
ncbi:MAG: TlpA family protein disulfide reductase [Selenomonas sp.]|uniref:TlpA family protein disulfide reductase n=1 Tax=Selenomonas sp. TaxID=2053611 RepID=UPI0025E39559|nr:TlpA disulfide reductase family protein [Selenomonas sp.]MCR5757277.1 TlpA family protein disulfide reductase [Selenomonas sp.]